jgi:hypothetical protein
MARGNREKDSRFYEISRRLDKKEREIQKGIYSDDM